MKNYLYFLLSLITLIITDFPAMSMSEPFIVYDNPETGLRIPLPSLQVQEKREEESDMDIDSESDTELIPESDSDDEQELELDSMEIEHSASLDILPTEIRERIISFAGQSIPTMRFVSRLDRELAERHITHLVLDIEDLTRAQFPSDRLRFLRVKKLKLTSKAKHTRSLLTVAQLQLLKEHFPAIEHLDISNIRVTTPEGGMCKGSFFIEKDELRSLRELVVESADIFSKNFFIKNPQRIQKLVIKYSGNDGMILQFELEKLGKEYSSLTYLDISGFRICSKEDNHWLWVFADYFPNLTYLDISSTNGVDDGGVYILHRALCQQKLTYLGLAHNKLTDDDIQAFAVPDKFTSLTQLDISHNKLTDQAITYLAEAPFAQQLTDLNLDSNRVCCSGITTLAKPGAFPQLIHLNLSRNSLDPLAIQTLAEAPLARQLTYLNLACNGITPTRIWELIQPNRFIKLEKLILWGNTGITDEEVQQRSGSLAQAPFAQKLKVLNLTGTGVSKDLLLSLKNYFPSLNTPSNLEKSCYFNLKEL